MAKALPLFTTDHSICDSTLTLSKEIYKKVEEEKDGTKVIRETNEVEISYPVSVFALAKIHKVDPLIIVESSMSGFWKTYKLAKDLKIPIVFGYKVRVCTDMAQKDDASMFTESNVIIFMKNSDGYQDLIKLSSMASVDGFYYIPRLDWATLNRMWTKNLSLAVPFYSSFLAQNLLKFKYCALPNFEQISDVVFFRQQQGLPFDGVLSGALSTYLKNNPRFEYEQAHSIYYYKDSDYLSHQTLKCISKRATLAKPNLNHYGSNQFSWESYERLYDR